MEPSRNRLLKKIAFFVVAFLVIGFGQEILFSQEGKRGELLGRLRNRLKGRQNQSGSIPGKPGQKATGEALQIADLRVSVWRPQCSQDAPSPLVIFSHGFHGSSDQSTFLMSALASEGYFVVAPNHKDSLKSGDPGSFFARPEEPLGKAENWSDKTYRDRADDILNLVAALKKDEHWFALIDWDKIALAGHSLGGYTVVGVAGGWPSWKLPGVKAILALSPYINPFIKKHNLGNLEIPVMYQGGTVDLGITPFLKKRGGAYDETKGPAYFVEFRKAGHFAWTDLRPDFQQSIILYSIAFLNKYVKGDKTTDPTVKLPDVSDLRFK